MVKSVWIAATVFFVLGCSIQLNRLAPPWRNIKTIAAGSSFSCGAGNGAARCWGANAGGQLGDGTSSNSSTPLQVLNLVANAGLISVGNTLACAIVNTGAFCWGTNGSGQLGNGTSGADANSSTPVPVTGLGSGVTLLASSFQHACAVVSGSAMCWGSNLSGRLGISDVATAKSAVPVQVTGITSGVTGIGAGNEHSCAAANGNSYCWGDNQVHQLGNGATTSASFMPVLTLDSSSGLTTTTLKSGPYYTCAIVQPAAGGSDVWCWGETPGGNFNVPNQVAGLTSTATDIVTGTAHACVMDAGVMKCWGTNTYGQLGDGTTADGVLPVVVQGLPGVPTAMAAGENHTCALVDGRPYCWGRNDFGQLGDGTTNDSPLPVTTIIPP